MMRSISRLLLLALALPVSTRLPAQIPVTDIGAIGELIQQVSYWQQQISSMSSQLNQLQSTYAAMTGPRGMQNLLALPPQVRNYLPSSYGALATGSSAVTLMRGNAVLPPASVARLSVAERAQLDAARRSPATLQAMTQQALTVTSERFASLQQLIDTLSRTNDQKAALDLQARIAAEHGMLQNEGTKLQLLYQAALAQQWVTEARRHEQAIASIGSLRTLAPLPLR